MTLSQLFIEELSNEAVNTRKVLQRIPLDKSGWKPHEHSMPIGSLTIHVAELPTWITTAIKTAELDFASWQYKPYIPVDNDDLLRYFNSNVDEAVAALATMSDEDFELSWTMRHGERIMSTLTKRQVVRNWACNHLVHHRGQLTVYLRLMGVPVPGLYGPSFDDKLERQAATKSN